MVKVTDKTPVILQQKLWLRNTDMHPRIVWWSDEKEELWLLDLIVSYESPVANSHKWKQTKYYELVLPGCAGDYGS